MSDEIKDLFNIIDGVKDELNTKISKLEESTRINKEVFKELASLKQAIELQRQLVNEYKAYKDPKNHEFAIEALQKQNGQLANKVQDVASRLKRFEVEEWLKLFTDEELRAEYIKAGSPTYKYISAKLNVTTENAYNYIHCKVTEPEKRWKFYLACIDYAKEKGGQ